LAEMQAQQNAPAEESIDELRDSGVYNLDEVAETDSQAVQEYLEKLDNSDSN